MRRDVADRTIELISRYNLHRSLPVSLEPLEEIYHIHHMPLLKHMGTEGLSLPPRDHPLTPDNPGIIALDDGLNDHKGRLILAHEIGHAICGHQGSLAFQGMDPWFRRKAEYEAWEAGAALLIPWYTWFGDLESVAQRCHVPRWLVRVVSIAQVH